MQHEHEHEHEHETEPKGMMSGAGEFQFFVVNLSAGALRGTVTWTGGSRSAKIDVNGLRPGTVSALQSFSPQGGTRDLWQWSQRGGTYQLNVYDDDRYTAVVISDYGIGILVTATAPDTWKW